MFSNMSVVNCALACGAQQLKESPLLRLLVHKRFSLGYNFIPHAYRFLRFAVQSAKEYFPCTVLVEDEEALKPGRPYIVGKTSVYVPAAIELCHCYVPHLFSVLCADSLSWSTFLLGCLNSC